MTPPKNTPLSRTLLAGAVALVLAGAAQAQSTGATTAPSGGTTAPGSTAPAPVDAPMQKRMQGRTAASDATHPLTAVRLSKLDDVNIHDAKGEKIGEIDDVIVDRRTGAVQHVVVSTGGLLGVGEKKRTVALSDLQVFSRSADDSVPARATVAKGLDSMPEAKRLEKGSPHVEAEDLIGTDVVDAQGKEIGEIEDVVVDLKSGQAQYALMEFDKSWSPMDKLYAFRMAEFQPAKDGGKLMLSVRKEAIEELPSLDKSALDRTDLADPSWTAKLSQAPGANARPAN